MTKESAVDVAVVGAGPYGLAATAYLRGAGLRVHTFGEAMGSWRTGMPSQMLLRSSLRASSIAHPRAGFRIEDWYAEVSRPISQPILLQDFLDYASWWAQKVVPDIDPRRVAQISRTEVLYPGSEGFVLRLSDGALVAARRVVVALGFESSARWPDEVAAAAPDQAVSHVADNLDLAGFAGRRLVVIGSGQSALESAAIAHEAGAEVQIVSRSPQINWLSPMLPVGERPPGLPRPPTDVGGVVTGWLAAAPDAYHLLPTRMRRWVQRGCLRPAGAHLLRARLADVPMYLARRVDKVRVVGEGEVEVALEGGDVLTADHVLLGTGYDVDIRRFGLLSPDLMAAVRCSDGMPQLRTGFESSVPGLHFLGSVAVHSFGPINRFITGTWYAGPALTRRASGQRGPAWSLAFSASLDTGKLESRRWVSRRQSRS